MYLNVNSYKHLQCDSDMINAAIKDSVKSGQIVVNEAIKEYKTYFKRYDCFQMFKHILACYNYCAKHRNIKKITLVNCVWEIKNPDLIVDLPKRYATILAEENNEFDVFKKMTADIKTLFKKELNVEFNIEYIPYYEFAEKIIVLSDAEKDYLKRYNF